jgi:hypothetical protein
MDSTLLLEKLLDIERGIGTLDSLTLRNMVIDAEECLLRLQGAKAQAAHSGSITLRAFLSPRSF